MKTSLNEIKYIESYLNSSLNEAERSAFEAQLVIDYHLRMNVFLQQKIYKLVRFYKRRSLKQQAERVHHRLFNDPNKATFTESIHQLF
jgi:hypothetical protein